MSEDSTPRGSTLRRLLLDFGGALVFPLFAILISFLIGAVIVLATGNNPLEAYAALLEGAVGSPTAIGTTLLGATPLIFTGLAVAVAFRAGLFNIGGEGQLYIGAITAAWLGVSCLRSSAGDHAVCSVPRPAMRRPSSSSVASGPTSPTILPA